ncbi:MAG: hypothetical protein LBJ73_01420 [Rickettsiales bacterium]|jgi:hypothetical protein|nr:hypothetical protein [Rickettsiales bacterium]
MKKLDIRSRRAARLCLAMVLSPESGYAFYCATSMTSGFATYCTGRGGTISAVNTMFPDGTSCSYICTINTADKASFDSYVNNATVTGSCGSNATPVYGTVVISTSPANCVLSDYACGGSSYPTPYSINSASKSITSCLCAAGFWGVTSVPTTCTRCPKICDNPSGTEVFGASAAGSTAQTQCYAPAGTQCQDSGGIYEYEAKCSYQ